MQPDPTQLRMLWLVGEHGSLSGAAAELGLTPAAVTGQVSRAERDWGLPLVDRGPGGARLTEAGAALAHHGATVDAACQQALLGLDHTRSRARRRLRIGTFMSAALRVLPEAVTALRHHHLDSELSIVEGTSHDLCQRVVEGRLDVAVVGTYGETDSLGLPASVRATPLLHDPLVVCLPSEHRLAAGPPRRRVRLSQLRDEAWVAILAGEAARAQFDHAARAVDLRPRVQFETESYDVAQALVATGLGVAVLSQLAARPVPGAVHRELERPRLSRRLWVVHRADTRMTPLVEDLVGLLASVCDDLDARWRSQPLQASIRQET